MSRLARGLPEVYEAFALLSPAEQKRGAGRLVAAGLEIARLDPESAMAPGAVERLDAVAWGVGDLVGTGRATADEYAAAFARARAASAAAALREAAPDLENVVYEAVHALPATVDPISILLGRTSPAASER